MLNNMSITRKLLFGPALAGLCMLLVAALFLIARDVEQRYAAQARDCERQAAEIVALTADLASGHANLFRGVTWLNVQVDSASVQRAIDKGLRHVDAAMARPVTSLDKTGKLELLLAEYHAAIRHLAEMVRLEPFMAAMSMNASDAAFEKAYEHLHVLAEAMARDAAQRRSAADRVKRVVWALCFIGVGGLFLLALISAVRIGRAIARPLADIVTTTVAFADGRLDVPIPGLDRGDEVGSIAGALEVFRETARQLNEQAYFDRLTGVPNRANFQRALERALVTCTAEASRGALLLIDLDRFKEVNDTLGHGAGDAVLCAAARRLTANVREWDLVARLGGDEFAVLISSAASDEALRHLACRLIAALGQPVRVGAEEAHVSASIGIALFPDHGVTAVDILKRADIAMYHAKARWSGSFNFFDSTFDTALQRRRAIESELRQVVAEGSIALVYQPKYRLTDGRLDSVEALARWPGVRGAVGPDEFIPIAEATGLINALGTLVIEASCRQTVAWRKAGVAIASVSVNVSVVQLRQPGFAESVRQIAAAFSVEPSKVLIELTEGVFADPDNAAIRDNILQLGQLGFGLSLDDFGTGFSSMGYLTRLPFKELKIDQSFVSDIGQSLAARGVVRGIIDLGHALGMRVVAEGVETAAQLRALRALGCDLGQGFLLGRPSPADALSPRLSLPVDASALAEAGEPSLAEACTAVLGQVRRA